MATRVPTPPRAGAPPPPPPEVRFSYICGVCDARLDPSAQPAQGSRWYCANGHRYRARYGDELVVRGRRFRVEQPEVMEDLARVTTVEQLAGAIQLLRVHLHPLE